MLGEDENDSDEFFDALDDEIGFDEALL